MQIHSSEKMMSETLRCKTGEQMTGSSIVFADDDDDDVDGSNCSVQSADDISRTDVRRGILRHPTNNHQNLHVDKRPAVLPISSPIQRTVPNPLVHRGTSICWPDWDIVNKPEYYESSARQNGNIPDRRQTGNEASLAESWKANEAGSNDVVRKKLTVRFSPEADDACVAGNGQSMRTPFEEWKGQVQGQHEPRRMNVGRIAENKFNDGRNSSYMSDATSLATKADMPKTSRKWYHFSFRSSKTRDKHGAEIESRSTAVPRPTYAELRSVDGQVELRCRGRREMRESSTYDVGDTESGYARTLVAHGYRLLPSSTPEPEQQGGQGWRASSTPQDWSQPVRSASSAYDLRRSPTDAEDGQKSRVAAAVRRSHSTVGDDRRRRATSSPVSELTVLPARRSSADLTLHAPAVRTTTDVSVVAVDSPAFLATQQAGFGWYYGLDGALNRHPLAATNDMTYHVRQTDQINLMSTLESNRSPAETFETGYRDVASTDWSGMSWTTPRRLRSSTTPVEGLRDVSSGGTSSHQVNPVISSDVASNYILRRESFTPVTRLYTHNWPVETQGNVARGLPEIKVTPATDKNDRRRFQFCFRSSSARGQILTQYRVSFSGRRRTLRRK